jgi:hypothetical protein
MDTNTLTEKPSMDWGSHLPALVACVAACDGPVLEIGAGHHSTPILHSLCAVLGKQLVTVEAEDVWREVFADYATDGHKVLKQTEELLVTLASENWGVVFVDDLKGPREDRARLFCRSSQFMVFHDYSMPFFGGPLDEWLGSEKFNSFVYRRYDPHTLVVSAGSAIPVFSPR